MWTLLGIVVIAAGAVVAYRLVDRRVRHHEARAVSSRALAGTDPAELEAQADEAERVGDLAGAIRLRFVAGLVRLDAAERITLARATTARSAARELRSPTFDELAGAFERVVYGGRLPLPVEVERSREGWSRLLREGASR